MALVFRGALSLAAPNPFSGSESHQAPALTLRLMSSTTIDEYTKAGKLSKATIVTFGMLADAFECASGLVNVEVKFVADADFNRPGALVVKSSYSTQLHLRRLELYEPNMVQFPCYSWVPNKHEEERIFFTNELCLPSKTLPGLVSAREKDLKALRGNGTGRREMGERIYDYDVYNDLSNTSNPKGDRPVLGGSKEYPYPRRGRTGRRVVNGNEVNDPNNFYIPSDERFTLEKQLLVARIPEMLAKIPRDNKHFVSLAEVFSLYEKSRSHSLVYEVLPYTSSEDLKILATSQGLKFPVPQVIAESQTAWMLDEEFGRQVLSGINPMVIERLNLDIHLHTSAHKEHIGRSLLEGFSLESALAENRLYVLNYIDAFLPYLERINAQDGAFVYASLTVFQLTSEEKLMPVLIELATTSDSTFFIPPKEGTTDWLWELAKIHVASNDSAYHQVISHWLRTHACIEPFVIATNRQLSKLHPLYAFLHPHLKDTMAINAQGRKGLMNAFGLTEQAFSSGRYSVEMSSAVYKSWKFNEQALPVDLLKRGMAVRRADGELELVIKDYPYAADGLLIWAAIEKWVADYVDIVYDSDCQVIEDLELQEWWAEVINRGHEDKRDEPGWIYPNSKYNLTSILTTFIWLTTAHHAAVNFGQYAFEGFMPNRPTATHRPVPEPSSQEYYQLMANPEAFMLSSVSTNTQATLAMAGLEVLSTHSMEESYLGQRAIKDWTNSVHVQNAFATFQKSVREVESKIQAANNDSSLHNRRGPVNMRYTLLYPTSHPGLTGKGVPNSISI